MELNTRSRPLTAREYRFAAALCLGCLAIAAGRAFVDENIFYWDDDAQFVVLAKALATGQGLHEINQPAAPAHNKFPAGFPLMLSLIERISPDQFGAMQWLSLLSFAGSIVLLYLVLLRMMEDKLALLIALLVLTNRLSLILSHQIMAEMPFLFFSTLSLLLLALLQQNRPAAKRYLSHILFIAAILCAVWSMAIKSVGLALVLAITIDQLRRRKWIGSLLVLVGVVLWYLPQNLWRGPVSTEESYLTQLLLIDPYNPAAGHLTLVTFAARFLSNVIHYCLILIPNSLVSVTSNKVIGLIIILIVFTGWLTSFRRWPCLGLFYAAYLGILFCWPRQWAVERMTIGLLPWTWLFLFQGARRIYSFSSKEIFQRLNRPLVVTLLAFLFWLGISAFHLHAVWQADISRDPHWQNYFKSLVWLRDNTPSGAAILCRKPYLTYLVTKRHTIGMIKSKEAFTFYQAMNKAAVSLVIKDTLPLIGTREYLVPRLKNEPQKFTPIYRTDAPATMIFAYSAGE